MASEGRDGERPAWAQRLRDERRARGWSQADVVRALRRVSSQTLASDESLVRSLKRWESGAVEPDAFYKPLLAASFGTVTTALFPVPATRFVGGQTLDTLEIVARLRVSDVSDSTVEALAIKVEQLCSEYKHQRAEDLLVEGRRWLRRVTDLLDKRLTLAQHREVLRLAGFLALLVGCVEYDLGEAGAAESTRRAAASLGRESGSVDIEGWALEMQAWFALTSGDHRGAVVAGRAGEGVAPRQGVAVQLAAQQAKAWARLGDRRETDAALARGRALLESLPYPSNLDNHFVVDPAKFDFYAMDCYRLLGEDALARSYAGEVLRAGTDAVGHERSPMRNAEARVTLGVVAARERGSGRSARRRRPRPGRRPPVIAFVADGLSRAGTRAGLPLPGSSAGARVPRPAACSRMSRYHVGPSPHSPARIE